MKISILTVVAAAAVLIGSATVAEAGPRYANGYRGAGYGAPSYRPSNQGYGNHGYEAQSHGHCEQPYVVSTVEVNRYTQCQTAYDHCGRPYTYHVTVVTYCDRYSNGATRTWSQTFS